MMSAVFLAALSVVAAPGVITSDTTYTVQSQLDAAADGIVIDEGVTLTLNPGTSGSLSVNHAISGAGGVAVTSGTVTFAVTSSYSGGTSVSNAKVFCSVTDALGSGEVSIDGTSAFVAYTQGSTTEGAAEVKNAPPYPLPAARRDVSPYHTCTYTPPPHTRFRPQHILTSHETGSSDLETDQKSRSNDQIEQLRIHSPLRMDA